MNTFILFAVLSTDVTLERCLLDSEPDDAAFSVALTEAIPGGTVRLGPGVLILERYPAELRHVTGQPCRRLDVTIVGDGTTIRGVGRPHDVLNLNAVAGVTLRNLTIESASPVTPDGHGVNGVSLTNGSYGVLCDRVRVRQVPGVFKGSHIDGGKAFTVQQGAGVDRSSVVFRDCSAEGCPIGFGVDAAPDKGVPGSIVIDSCEVRDALVGVALSFAAHKSPVSGFSVDVLNSTFIDVKRPLIASRTPDVRFCGNRVNVVAVPDWPDPYDRLWTAAVSVRDAPRVEISGNTVVYRPDRELWDVPGATVEGNIVRR